MLVVPRARDESMMFGDTVEVTIIDIKGEKVSLGITTPKHVPVHRREIYDAIQREKQEKQQTIPDITRSSICCSGAYGSRDVGQPAYVDVSLAGKKNMVCDSLDSDGYCCFEGAKPTKPCILGIERKVSP